MLRKLIVGTVVAIASFVGLMAGTASASACSGRGGMIFAQASGEGDMSVVQVWCADGTSWYLE